MKAKQVRLLGQEIDEITNRFRMIERRPDTPYPRKIRRTHHEQHCEELRLQRTARRKHRRDKLASVDKAIATSLNNLSIQEDPYISD